MDGRVQRPVSDYLLELFCAEHVDVVTDGGPVAGLASDPVSDHSTRGGSWHGSESKHDQGSSGKARGGGTSGQARPAPGNVV